MSLRIQSGLSENWTRLRRSSFTTALMLGLVASAFGQEFRRQISDSGREMLFHDSGIEVIRVTVGPHSSAAAFIHPRDYVFIPMMNAEIFESVRPGTGHGPWASSTDANAKTSWVPRDSQVRFIHPEETEPSTGRILFNDSDQPYVAIEINILDQELPELQPRLSLLTDRITDSRSWRFGTYVLTFQNVNAGAAVRFEGSSEGLFLSMSPLSLGMSSPSTPKSLNAGEPLSFRGDVDKYRNVTTFAVTLLLLERSASRKVLAANAGQ